VENHGRITNFVFLGTILKVRKFKGTDRPDYIYLRMLPLDRPIGKDIIRYRFLIFLNFDLEFLKGVKISKALIYLIFYVLLS
jgi:hypothetical protein